MSGDNFLSDGLSLLAQVPLRATPGPPPPLTAVSADGVRPQGLVLYQARGHIDQDVLEPGKKWGGDDFYPPREAWPRGGGGIVGLGAELGLVGDENLGGHNGWGGRGLFWLQAAAGLCIDITFPLAASPAQIPPPRSPQSCASGSPSVSLLRVLHT